MSISKLESLLLLLGKVSKMARQTSYEKTQDRITANASLERLRVSVENGGAVLLISADFGKGETDFFKLALATVGDYGRVEISHITWALAKVAGYRLADRKGSWFIGIGGGNFSKFDEIADTLARFYGVPSIRFERV